MKLTEVNSAMVSILDISELSIKNQHRFPFQMWRMKSSRQRQVMTVYLVFYISEFIN